MCDMLTRSHQKFTSSLTFLQKKKKKANHGQIIEDESIHNGAEQELPEQEEFMWTEITFTQERMEAQWFRW